jgi:hypothetical protein
MPFTPDEARKLMDAHPDQIILAVVKDGAQTVMLIPKARKRDMINFGGMEIEASMLHGGTYFIGGDRNVESDLAADRCRSVRADRIVFGERAGPLLPVVDNRPAKAERATPLPAKKKGKATAAVPGLF